MRKYDKSIELYKKAVNLIPGGVNSPVRAFKSVGQTPIFVKRSAGSKVYDEDDNEYIDYICSWGPLILGHNYPSVIEEVRKAIELGSSYGLPTKKEVELAKLICECIPSIEKVRLTTSGTEAAMAAVRLARAYTKKNKIVKFEGCYHGHSDSLLVKAGSGLLTFDILDSNGITEATTKDTIVLPYNDIFALEECFKKYENQISCVIIEPIAANMGLILPNIDFLNRLREITQQNNSLLIFDEVISGFRVGISGASGYYNIKPDLTILGKIIGGGYPIGAFGGKNEIMKLISPEGSVYHAGTLSGNPVSVSAGLATIKTLKENDSIYKTLEKNTKYIVDALTKIIKENNLKNVQINYIGSLFTIYFTSEKIENLNNTKSCDTKKFGEFFKFCLDNGIVIPPSQFEALFLSYAHTEIDIEKTIDIFGKFLLM
ncbi:MAG: glutamate-1-semialdehyde-2,1-aminomutase [Spirochaetes bacterium GWD1_27_9]|nr:MAG: glutamate-1-semialdehyde-2,1-aminomutase [Spirochaetes bacterium GWB1_27_13]OHD26037.1 MAG: glutamate-1-semialdehyde-2,1-aminomutase [Spirochaetes bacterium GWC1_27_15]OHD45109.1 MAG: glutamate-1-semialdehyde-2,1-aminomutase [Spirochaetes bacterium GWD1_27_9]